MEMKNTDMFHGRARYAMIARFMLAVKVDLGLVTNHKHQLSRTITSMDPWVHHRTLKVGDRFAINYFFWSHC